MALKQSEKLLGTLGKYVSITMASPHENIYGTPVAVPASEPGTALSSITIASGDMPTLSGGVFERYSKTGLVLCFGLNLTASQQTINFRLSKNSTSISTGATPIIASNYFTMRLENTALLDLAVGDVLELKIWASATDIFDLRFFGVHIGINKVRLDIQSPIENTVFNPRSTNFGSDFTGIGCPSGYSFEIAYPTNSTTAIYFASWDTCIIPEFYFVNDNANQYSIRYLNGGSSSISSGASPSMVGYAIMESVYWEV